jgi:signal transduction histidine kinase/ActR/RegA family two-component response regulator
VKPTTYDSRLEARRLALAGLVAVTLILLGAVALIRFAAGAVDQVQVREERQLVARTLDQLAIGLQQDVTTATVWDQAYEILRPGGDLAWADSEIGSYYANNRGHDRTLAYDAADRPFYACSGENRVPATDLAEFQRDARPLLNALRKAESVRKPPTADHGQTDPDLAVTVKGLVRSRGVLYLVVGSTVEPEVWNAPKRPGPAVAVLSAKRLDRTLLPYLSGQLQIHQPRLTEAGAASRAAMTLHGLDGEPVGAVVWEPKRPGLSMLKQALPLLITGFAALVMTGALLTVRTLAVIRRLGQNEARLSHVVRDLMVARDSAQDASRAKSEFLANMSHEIRTPLNGVLGMAQVMSRHPMEAEQTKRLEVIREQGELLLHILNAVLDISKIESGKLELESHPFDLVQEVRAACEAFANQARLKDVEFQIEIDHAARGGWIGDDLRLRQVLNNLVSNAVKFTSQGQVRVEVRSMPDGLRFEVRDTGIGVPADKIESLFEKFTQADGSTTRRFGGTGLGLAISRELVELMGGRLEASSAPGAGSTFSFTLPLERCKTATARQAGADDSTPVEPGSGVRILAAEDNPTNQLILRALLEPLHVDLTLVENGVAAVDAFRTAVFDLVLMDAQMPELNGPEAAAAIRRIETEEGRARTPILALTANVMNHQLATYVEAGMDGYVAKPIDAAKLFEAVIQATQPAMPAEPELLRAANAP